MSEPLNLIFATGSTLWSSDQWIMYCYERTFAELKKRHPDNIAIHIPDEAERRTFCGPSLDTVLTGVLGDKDEKLIKEAHDIYRHLHDTDEGLKAVRPHLHIPELLAQLKSAGYSLFVATEKSRVNAVTSLQHWKIRDFFQIVAGAPSGGAQTSFPQILSELSTQAQACLLQDVSPENSYVISGRLKNIVEAQQAGYPIIGVTWGGTRERDLLEAGAGWVVTRPEGLLPTLVIIQAKRNAPQIR